MVRRVLLSDWTVLWLLALGVFLHARWYGVGKAIGGEVVSGSGAWLVALGVLVASRPYIRAGWDRLINAGLPAYGAGFMTDDDTLRKHHELLKVERPKVVRDVLNERVIAVVVIVVGTMLNGYGPLIARALHLRAA